MQKLFEAVAAMRSGGLMLTCVRVPRLAQDTRRLADMLQRTEPCYSRHHVPRPVPSSGIWASLIRPEYEFDLRQVEVCCLEVDGPMPCD